MGAPTENNDWAELVHSGDSSQRAHGSSEVVRAGYSCQAGSRARVGAHGSRSGAHLLVVVRPPTLARNDAVRLDQVPYEQRCEGRQTNVTEGDRGCPPLIDGENAV